MVLIETLTCHCHTSLCCSISSSERATTMNVVCVSSCMLSWTFLYASLCYMVPHKSCEWISRIIAVVHAIIVISLSGWSMLIQGPNPFTDPGMYTIYTSCTHHHKHPCMHIHTNCVHVMCHISDIMIPA